MSTPTCFGGRVAVSQAWFNLFVGAEQSRDRQMLYRLWLTPESGDAFTLVGFKDVHDDPGFDLWDDTTTLYVQLLDGHVPPADGQLGSGLLPRLTRASVAPGSCGSQPLDFGKQLTTFRADGPDGVAAIAASAGCSSASCGGRTPDWLGLADTP